jgi:hypothetical protein
MDLCFRQVIASALEASHAPRKSWQWPKDCPAVDQARKVLGE